LSGCSVPGLSIMNRIVLVLAGGVSRHFVSESRYLESSPFDEVLFGGGTWAVTMNILGSVGGIVECCRGGGWLWVLGREEHVIKAGRRSFFWFVGYKYNLTHQRKGGENKRRSQKKKHEGWWL